MKKFDPRKYCDHARFVDQKGLLLHSGGGQHPSSCDTMDLIKLNYCPYCGLKLRKETEHGLHQSEDC
jgi:hypothetical protein